MKLYRHYSGIWGGGRQGGSSCVVAGTVQITKTDMICFKHYEPPPKGQNALFSYNQGTDASHQRNGGGGRRRDRQGGSSCVAVGTVQITKTDMICPKHYEPPPKG